MAKIRLKPGIAKKASLGNKILTFTSHSKWFYVAIALLTYIIVREALL
jgi:hypothetical protein